MDDAWQSQDMAPSNPGGPISIPTTDVNMSNGNGHAAAGDDPNWAAGGAHSPRPAGDSLPRRSSRSRSPVAREGGDRGRDVPGSTNPGNNLHVSGLTSKVESRDLEAAFAKVGRVQKASVMYDPHSRESRGFGFVTMETGEEADAAVTALNATEMFGKIINVEKARRARARTPTPGRYYGPPKRGDDERPYDPRPYDNRYRDRDGGRGRRERYGDRDRYNDREHHGDRDYDRYHGGGRRDGGRMEGGGRYSDGRDYDRDRYSDYGRGYDRRYGDGRY